MRRSPGSPSQIMAALLRRAVRTCRSRQFALALILPPSNQRAYGAFHWRTESHGRIHSSSRANSAQNASGSRARAFVDARNRRCWRISAAPPKGETGDLPEGDCQSRPWLLGHFTQRGNPCSNGGRARSAYSVPACSRNNAVVLYGSRRLVRLIVQLRKIVMRRSICRGSVQHVEQVFLRHINPAGTALGQRQVDQGVDVARGRASAPIETQPQPRPLRPCISSVTP